MYYIVCISLNSQNKTRERLTFASYLIVSSYVIVFATQLLPAHSVQKTQK